MTPLDRFTGERGRRLCVEALAAERLVSGNCDLADCAEVLAVSAGQTLISQGADDNDIYFILAGTFDVVVDGRRVDDRGAATMSPKWRPCSLLEKVCDGYCARRSNRRRSWPGVVGLTPALGPQPSIDIWGGTSASGGKPSSGSQWTGFALTPVLPETRAL
jgi:hypothetical protein